MSRLRCAVLLLASVLCGCFIARPRGGEQPEGGPERRDLFGRALDPTGAYASAGLLAHGEPLPFIGAARFLAGRAPDSTLVLIALSLANRALTFASEGNGQRAGYVVTIEARREGAAPRHIEMRQTVRVASFRETQRADESVIFQRYLTLEPGEYALVLGVRDAGSPRASLGEYSLSVPRVGARSLSSPVPVYQGTPRLSTDSAPDLIANPHAMAVFGRDSTLTIYLEGYGLEAGARVTLATLNGTTVMWQDTIALSRHGSVDAALVSIPVTQIGVGSATLAATRIGSADTVRTPLFVSLGDQWPIMSFDELVSALRYFATAERLDTLRRVRPESRGAAWAAFLRATDPSPETQENEALRDYFARLQLANDRFRDEGIAGWLTERGRVLINLGEPDQLLEDMSVPLGDRGNAQAWVYNQLDLRLVFIDQTGFGHWRLTQRSEADFELAVRRERSR